jgi:hypothetical protein
MPARKRSSAARRGKGAKSKITTKQKSARRKNMAIARKSKKKGKLKLSSAHGDFQYSSKSLAKSFINRAKKPGSLSLMKSKKTQKYLVTTNRRSGSFANQGFKRVSQWG